MFQTIPLDKNLPRINMPFLRNPKHEHFAHLIAKGLSPTEAYVSAGYSENGAHASASRLLAVATVRARVEELIAGIEHASLEKAILDRTWVIEGLKRIADKAEKVNDFNPAIKAHELLGKELGMFVNRSDITISKPITELTDEELNALVAAEGGTRSDSPSTSIN